MDTWKFQEIVGKMREKKPGITKNACVRKKRGVAYRGRHIKTHPMYPNHPRYSPNAAHESAERAIRGIGTPPPAAKPPHHDIEAAVLARAYVHEKLSEAEHAVDDGLHGVRQHEGYFRIKRHASEAERVIDQLKKAQLDGKERTKFEKITSKYRDLMAKVLGMDPKGYAVPVGT